MVEALISSQECLKKQLSALAAGEWAPVSCIMHQLLQLWDEVHSECGLNTELWAWSLIAHIPPHPVT